MQIAMKTLAAGPKGVLLAGKTYDVPEKEARELIAGGYAVEVKEPPRSRKPEKATGGRGREKAVAVAADEIEGESDE